MAHPAAPLHFGTREACEWWRICCTNAVDMDQNRVKAVMRAVPKLEGAEADAAVAALLTAEAAARFGDPKPNEGKAGARPRRRRARPDAAALSNIMSHTEGHNKRNIIEGMWRAKEMGERADAMARRGATRRRRSPSLSSDPSWYGSDAGSGESDETPRAGRRARGDGCPGSGAGAAGESIEEQRARWAAEKARARAARPSEEAAHAAARDAALAALHAAPSRGERKRRRIDASGGTMSDGSVSSGARSDSSRSSRGRARGGDKGKRKERRKHKRSKSHKKKHKHSKSDARRERSRASRSPDRGSSSKRHRKRRHRRD